MAKTELKGKIMSVSAITQVGEKNTPKQSVILTVPPYRDEFGEVKGKEENWELTVIGDQVAKLGLTESFLLKKAHVKCYLNSNTVKSKDTGNDMYIINAVIASLEIIP